MVLVRKKSPLVFYTVNKYILRNSVIMNSQSNSFQHSVTQSVIFAYINIGDVASGINIAVKATTCLHLNSTTFN